MAEGQYRDYLAARVLVEQKPVTYRLLSRAVNTDVNTAKGSVHTDADALHARAALTEYRMLFDFHQKQNAKKPKSVHATYLITGTKRNTEDTIGTNGRNGEDATMRSSPFMSSMPEPEESVEAPVNKTSIVLVREEELKGA